MKKLICILFLCVCFGLKAQPPSKWYNKFGGNGVDIGYGVKETYGRNYIVIGSTSSFGKGAVDAYLILVDSMGQKVWEKTFGGALSDVGKRIVVNPIDSGFIFTGYTSSFGNGGYDVYLVRTDKNGNLIWQRSYGGLDWDFGNDIVLAPDGNVIICGYTYSFGYGKKDGYLIKVNSNSGNLMWQKYFGGTEDDDFRSLKVTTTNSIVLTGETKSYNDPAGDIYFLRTNLNGDSLLYRSYGLKNKEDFGASVIENASLNGYVMAGGTESYATYGKDAFIFGTDLNGDSLWFQNYSKPGVDEQAVSVLNIASTTGTYCLAYSEISLAAFKRNPVNLILDYTGIYIDGYEFGFTEDDELYQLSPTSDKGFIGTGYSNSFGSVDTELYLIKYDSSAFYGGNLIGLPENQAEIKNDIRIFPTILDQNHAVLKVDCPNKYNFSIIDVYGKKIKNGIGDANLTSSIDLNELSSGIYFFVVAQNQRSTAFKFVKKD
jgi:hypothetical protein